jgi:hypothetical protein
MPCSGRVFFWSLNFTPQNTFFPAIFSSAFTLFILNVCAKKQPQFIMHAAIQGFSRHKNLFQFLLACSDFLL